MADRISPAWRTSSEFDKKIILYDHCHNLLH